MKRSEGRKRLALRRANGHGTISAADLNESFKMDRRFADKVAFLSSNGLIETDEGLLHLQSVKRASEREREEFLSVCLSGVYAEPATGYSPVKRTAWN